MIKKSIPTFFRRNGKLTNSVRNKLLEQLGFGVWENSQDPKALQIKRANKEQLELIENGLINSVKEVDDHNLHINEHICFMLSSDFESKVKLKPELEKVLMVFSCLSKKDIQE